MLHAEGSTMQISESIIAIPVIAGDPSALDQPLKADRFWVPAAG